MNYSDIYIKLEKLVLELKRQMKLLEKKHIQLKMIDSKLKYENRHYQYEKDQIIDESDQLILDIQEKYLNEKKDTTVDSIKYFIFVIIWFIFFHDGSIEFFEKFLMISSVLGLVTIPFRRVSLNKEMEEECKLLKKDVRIECDELKERLYDLENEHDDILNEIDIIKEKVLDIEYEITRIVYNSFMSFDKDNINNVNNVNRIDIQDHELYDKFSELVKKLADYEMLKVININLEEVDCEKLSLSNKNMIKSVYDWEMMCSEISELVVDNFSNIDKNGYVNDKIVGRVRVRKR